MFSNHRIFYVLFLISAIVFAPSCKKTEEQLFEDNEALVPHRISTIRVQSYVNRAFIDLIGRSPLPDELTWGVDLLRSGDLSKEVRETLVVTLQTDSTFRVGDISYKDKYYQRIYDIVKSRMIEGAADVDFGQALGNARNLINRGRLIGDSVQVFKGLDELARNQGVLDSRVEYMTGEITLNTMFARMLNNAVYDVINMNSFNFVNASYDDLFYRFPSNEEFDIAYSIIDRNEVGPLFGGFASNKSEYCELLCNSAEFYEGLVNWAYLSLMGREATTQEVHNHFADLYTNSDFQLLQKNIIITDEYADF